MIWSTIGMFDNLFKKINRNTILLQQDGGAMIKGIHHVSMKCNTEEEINKVKDFYISVLDLKIVREWPDGFMIYTGNGYIEIFTNADGEHRLGSIRHFALVLWGNR